MAIVVVWLVLTCLLWRLSRGIRRKLGRWGFVISTVLLILLFPVLLLFLMFTLNYCGYCTWKTDGRYLRVPVERDGIIQSCAASPLAGKDLRGRRFTTEERLGIAINNYLCSQLYEGYNPIAMAEGMKGASSDDVKKRFTLIPYSSKEEFLRENPDCCQLTWRGSEGYSFPVWDTGTFTGDGRVSGVGNGMFEFKYKVRYLDQQGTRKEIERTSYIRVNNCGNPAWGR